VLEGRTLADKNLRVLSAAIAKFRSARFAVLDTNKFGLDFRADRNDKRYAHARTHACRCTHLHVDT
jgi:hypothetical protein